MVAYSARSDPATSDQSAVLAGPPEDRAEARMPRTARNRRTQRRLRQEAERLTGERYSL